MKIIYNKHLPPKPYSAINLFGVVFARHETKPLDKRMINHESIHTAQAKEMLYILFYLTYIIECTIRLIQYRDTRKSYLNISFEREAYANDYDLDYLKNRKWWSWCKYIRNKK